MPTTVSGKAEQAGDSASLELVARAGLVAYGVVHLLIGWLAVRIACRFPLTAAALGFVAFGVFVMLQSRYRGM